MDIFLAVGLHGSYKNSKSFKEFIRSITHLFKNLFYACNTLIPQIQQRYSDLSPSKVKKKILDFNINIE